MQKNILNVALAASFFHAPILVFVSLFGMHFGGVQIGVYLLVLNIVLRSCSGRAVWYGSIHTMDVFMMMWLIALSPSVMVTLLSVADVAKISNLNESSLFLIAAYLLIRMAWVRGYEVDYLMIWLMKVSCGWIIVEFFIVNTFGLNQVIEDYLNPVFKSMRLYDGLARGFVKAAGPIPGSQNASFISVVAFYVFAYAADRYKNFYFRLWCIVAIVAFFCTFTLTGLIALILIASARFSFGICAVLLTLMLGAWLGGEFGWMDYVLAIKNGNEGGVGGQYSEYIKLFGLRELPSVFGGVFDHPLGIGWGGASEYVGDEFGVNQEVYILRLIALGGLPVLLFLIYFFCDIIMKNLWSRKWAANHRVAPVYIFSILVSTCHYATFAAPAIIVIFAAMCSSILFSQHDLGLENM